MKKTTLIAVAAFAVLLAIVLATRETQVNEGVLKLTLPVVDGSKVTRIELSGGQSATLTREADHWTVADPKSPEKTYPADDMMVKTALTQLEKLKATEFVTSKAEKQTELEVDAAKGLHVKLSGITPALDVVIGKANRDGVFVREPNASAVFVAPAFNRSTLDKNVTGWRKKSVTTFAAADVKELRVAPAGAEPFTLTRAESGLTLAPLPKDFRFDAAAADRLLTQLATLNAQDFGTPPASADVLTVFTATTKDGKTVTLRLAKKLPAGTAPLSIEGDPETYLLPGWTADALAKGLEGLRDLRLTTAEPSKIESLTITTAKGKTAVKRDGTQWKLLEPKTPPAGVELDLTTALGVATRLANLRAAKVATGVDDAKAGLTKPKATVELGLEGGGKQTLRFGADASTGQAYVKGSADALLYELPVFERNNLDKGVELFKKPAPMPSGNVAGLEQLPPEIRQQLEAQLRQRGAH